MNLCVASVVLSLTLLSDGLLPVLGPQVLLASAAPLYTPGAERRVTSTRKAEQKPTNEEMSVYLEKYGYLEKRKSSKFTHSDKDIKLAIRHLQRFGGIKESGSWNNETVDLFRRPRCGLPDNPSTQGARRRRYVLSGGRWLKTSLNYRIQTFSSKLKPLDLLKVFLEAFKLWSAVVPLKFQQTYTSALTDIEISFARLDHKDGFPFDGPGGTLSHTFSAPDGRMHYDDEEAWTIGSPDGIDLRQVAAHEIGHVIGLGHSSEPGSIMNPFYPGFQPDVRLSQDDTNGAQSLYGVPSNYVPLYPNDKPSSSSKAATTTTTTTTTTPTSSAAESQGSITSSSTTTSSSSSSSSVSQSPIAAAAVLTPKLEPRTTPRANTQRMTATRTTRQL